MANLQGSKGVDISKICMSSTHIHQVCTMTPSSANIPVTLIPSHHFALTQSLSLPLVCHIWPASPPPVNPKSCCIPHFCPFCSHLHANACLFLELQHTLQRPQHLQINRSVPCTCSPPPPPPLFLFIPSDISLVHAERTCWELSRIALLSNPSSIR